MGSSRRQLLNQSTHSSGANSTLLKERHGPHRWHLGLEQADDGFCQGIVVRVPNTADRRLDAGLGEALGVLDRHGLNAPDALLFVKRRSEFG